MLAFAGLVLAASLHPAGSLATKPADWNKLMEFRVRMSLIEVPNAKQETWWFDRAW